VTATSCLSSKKNMLRFWRGNTVCCISEKARF